MNRTGTALLRRIVQTLVVAVVLMACMSCGPRIHDFSATPQLVCEGEPTVIRWQASGDLAMALRSEPAPPSEGGCGAAGLSTVALTLIARKGKTDVERKTEVGFLTGHATEPVVLPTNTIEGSDVVARGQKASGLWESKIEIATLAACHGRTIQAAHADRTVSLAASGAQSDALAGTALGGAWELRSPMTAEEQANPALRPKELTVLVGVRCKPAPR